MIGRKEFTVQPHPGASWFSVPIGDFMERVNVFAYFHTGAVLQEHFGKLEPDDNRAWFHLMMAKFQLGLILHDPVARELPLTQKRGKELASILDKKSDEIFDANTGDTKALKDNEVKSLKENYKRFEQLLAEELARAAVYAVHRKGIFDTSLLIDRADEVIPETLRRRLEKDCVHDLKQAGRCVAFELPTATGFHLMRATESSMWAYWKHLKRKKRPTNSNWGNAIKDLGALPAF